MKEKAKLLVSFSGGETSAFMAQWLWNHKKNEYDMIFVFANTGQENEETLEFVGKCSKHFGFPVIWVEANVHYGERKGSTATVVDYITANRTGGPFEAIIKKYGIPNMGIPHCTREMKEVPIRNYAKSIGWAKWFTAIGIRADELGRMNDKREKKRLVYPLIHWHKMTKPMINLWWSKQPFRLPLKGYQGNCKTCWKKHDPKLFQMAKEDETHFDFMAEMERKYEMYTPDSRLKIMAEKGKQPTVPYRFFRKNRSVSDMLLAAQKWDGQVIDDSQVDEKGIQLSLDLLNDESCEVFSGCGDEEDDV